MDLGRARDTSVLLAGMGRGGTTWAGNLLNYDGRRRVLFEPFHPEHVRLARGFERPHYIHPDKIDHPLTNPARRILAGRPRGEWVDRDNPGWAYRGRIVKEIQANLMLGWLRKIAPQMPIVLMVRHPMAVLKSWSSLGWADAVPGQVRGFERVAQHEELLRDYPRIAAVLETIDPRNPLDRVIFQWAVYHYVPVRQLGGDFHTLYYERLVMEPERETERLFAFLGWEYDTQAVKTALGAASSTNFLKRDVSQRAVSLAAEWRQAFDKEQIDRANRILEGFGLDGIYDADGLPRRDHLVDAVEDRPSRAWSA